MKTKEMKGITLVALVVTIVVLLILAGVSINAVIGDDGIIKKAQNSANLTKEAEVKEAINRTILEF
ncbi:MAG: type II secretion system protein, partial [Clostridia bacterium]